MRLGQPLLHKTDVVAAVPGGAEISEAKRGAAELGATARVARLGQPLLHKTDAARSEAKTDVVAAVPGGAEISEAKRMRGREKADGARHRGRDRQHEN